jgi:hypothetical protein
MRPVARQLFANVVATALALGCGSPAESGGLSVPPRDASPLQTELLDYSFVFRSGDYAGTVLATYTNAGSTPVFLNRCSERSGPVFSLGWAWTGSAPTHLEGPIWACVGVPPIQVLPGESRTDTLRFFLGEVQPNGQYTSQPRNAGRLALYRIIHRAYARVEGSGDLAKAAGPLPTEAGRSNIFRARFTR